MKRLFRDIVSSLMKGRENILKILKLRLEWWWEEWGDENMKYRGYVFIENHQGFWVHCPSHDAPWGMDLQSFGIRKEYCYQKELLDTMADFGAYMHQSILTIHWYLIYLPCRAYLQLYILNKFNYINFETYEEKNSLTLRSTSLIMQRRQILRATFLYTCTCNMHICII